MGTTRFSPKDTVRIRSEGRCEKCEVILTRNVNGMPESNDSRSIHHRQPKREGGRDSVVCMVHICIGCHKDIHDDEETAAKGGWIVLGRDPGKVPYLSHRGWVLPQPDGSLLALDFESGHAGEVYELPTPPRARRKRVATRPQYDRRNSSRKIPRVA